MVNPITTTWDHDGNSHSFDTDHEVGQNPGQFWNAAKADQDAELLNNSPDAGPGKEMKVEWTSGGDDNECIVVWQAPWTKRQFLDELQDTVTEKMIEDPPDVEA